MEIFSSKMHVDEKSHTILIIQEEGIPYNLKMTYVAHNATERFTGELLINGKWEYHFDHLDLGYTTDSSVYIRNAGYRSERCKTLQSLGTKFFLKVNK